MQPVVQQTHNEPPVDVTGTNTTYGQQGPLPVEREPAPSASTNEPRYEPYLGPEIDDPSLEDWRQAGQRQGWRERVRQFARDPENIREEQEMSTIVGGMGSMLLTPVGGYLASQVPALPGRVARIITANDMGEIGDELFGMLNPVAVRQIPNPIGGAVVSGAIDSVEYFRTTQQVERNLQGEISARPTLSTGSSLDSDFQAIQNRIQSLSGSEIGKD
jgi:hypothetical protein